MKARLSTRLSTRELDAINEALGFRLAGELDDDDIPPAAVYESAQEKVRSVLDARLQRETQMLALLAQALTHIIHELQAAGPDEVKQHPMLRSKDRFVERARQQIEAWRAEAAR